jgi:hypothetical protein
VVEFVVLVELSCEMKVMAVVMAMVLVEDWDVGCG